MANTLQTLFIKFVTLTSVTRWAQLFSPLGFFYAGVNGYYEISR